MIGFAALLVTTSKVWFFTYNPYFVRVGIPIEEYGIIFFFLNVIAWLSSKYGHRVEQTIGERACVITMVLCLGVPILLMALFPSQPVAYLVLVQNVVRGFQKPFVDDYLNRHIESSMRATVLSVQSSAGNLASVAGLIIFGVFTANFSLLSSLTLLGAIALVFGLWSYRSYLKNVT
jgi:predicted MFS family arabinose efflux permease